MKSKKSSYWVTYYQKNKSKLNGRWKKERERYPWLQAWRSSQYYAKKKGYQPIAMTREEFKVWFEKQPDGCKICGHKRGQGKRIVVDHCHKTGRPRGLLCQACNTAIGFLKESVELLQQAAEYLRSSSEVK